VDLRDAADVLRGVLGGEAYDDDAGGSVIMEMLKVMLTLVVLLLPFMVVLLWWWWLVMLMLMCVCSRWYCDRYVGCCLLLLFCGRMGE